MQLDKERAVPINEQNLLFGSQETLPGYSSIVEVEAFNLPPHITPTEFTCIA